MHSLCKASSVEYAAVKITVDYQLIEFKNPNYERRTQ